MSSEAAAAAVPPRAQEYVYIKRTGGGLDEVYAPLCIDELSSVGLLAERACAKFPRWETDAGQVRLFLVRHVGVRKPPVEVEASAAQLDEPALSLFDAGVVSGSWLLARVSLPAAAPGALVRRVALSLRHTHIYTRTIRDALPVPSPLPWQPTPPPPSLIRSR